MTDSANQPSPNIIITGFMGTGKTTVGEIVAKRLERDFIDMDTQLVAHFGKPIAEVFAEQGEAAFRVAEAQLCQQLAQRQGLVISTGGGALVNHHNRQALQETGVIICLTASVDEIVRRVASMNDRPLLPGTFEERRRRVQDLLHERRQAYAAIPHQVSTTARAPETIANAVIQTLEAHAEVPDMTRIPVENPLGTPYDICIGEGLLPHVGTLLSNREVRPGVAGVVTNEAIAALHGEPLLESLRGAGFEPALVTVPEGEQHKTLQTVSTMYTAFLAAGMDRRSPVISLGGGVIGDMAGFAAASYLRGVPFVQIPTSLLSMVDASVGGKTGVDLPQGKNLVGAFKQPKLVLIDTGVLNSLPAAEFRSGLAEIIKHGIIAAPDLFEQLETHGPTSLPHLVADAVRVKVDVVQEDPYEQGRRATLNLGHTFGHAIEQVSEYTVRHGEGVGLGLIAAAHLAASIDRCPYDLVDRIHNVVDRVGLPTTIQGYDADAIIAAMATDKKRSGKTLRFIIPQALGDVTIIDDPGTEFVRAAVEKILE